jgi:hypothetical protein
MKLFLGVLVAIAALASEASPVRFKCETFNSATQKNEETFIFERDSLNYLTFFVSSDSREKSAMKIVDCAGGFFNYGGFACLYKVPGWSKQGSEVQMWIDSITVLPYAFQESLNIYIKCHRIH